MITMQMGGAMADTIGATKRGRREKKDPVDGRFGFVFRPSLAKRLREFSQETGEDLTEIAERALQRELAGGGTAPVDAAMRQKRCKYLSALPCGPLAPALAEASDYLVSYDIAEMLDIQNDDFISVMNGNSMQGAGIESNDLVAFRPVPAERTPFNGDICAIQVISTDGNVRATVKHWHNTPPHLTDGDGNAVELDTDTERLVPIGVAKALFRRL